MAEALVAVVWDDAHVEPTETLSREQIHDCVPIQMTTFGLLVRRDNRLVGVAAEQCADGTFRGVTYVPTAIVKDIISLGRWPKRVRAKKVETVIQKESAS